MIEWLVQRGYFVNANHAIWFTFSIFTFVFVSQLLLSPSPWTFVLPLVFHGSPVVMSIVKIYIRKQRSDIYSKDCIWFNALMVFGYLVFLNML